MRETTLITILLAFYVSITFSQDVSIETDKNKYKTDEKIEVKFKIDFYDDTVKFPAFEGFKIIGGPSVSSSTTIINGQKKYAKSWTYILRPVNSGILYINSPEFYLDGKLITADTKEISVLESEMTTQEQQEIKFRSFVEDNFKPEGTYRYVIYEDFGYIEVFKDLKWNFHRRLTQDECIKLRKLE